MTDIIVKYLDGELPESDKSLFLASVIGDKTLTKEFVDYHHLLAYMSFLPQEEDKIHTEKKLRSLLDKTENNNSDNKNV